MAKVLSHVWSSISGSVGGITYFNGPHASIIARARVEPVQPGSTNQSLARSAITGSAAVWETLPLADQEDWEAYAQTCTFQGKQGNYQITGRSMFMAGRAMQDYLELRLLAIPTKVVTPPVTTGFLVPSGFNLTAPAAPGTGFSVNFNADPTDDTLFFVQTSAPFEKEKNFWKGPWDKRLDDTQIVNGGAGGFLDVVGLAADKTYFVRVKAVADDAAPRTSVEYFFKTVAVLTGP